MRALILAVLLAGGSAGAEVLAPHATLDTALAPGAFEEMCFELGAGQAIRYTFDAGAPLEFNIHWHRGREVVYPVRSAAVARRGGVFRATESEAYCLMWTNRGRAAVPLRVRLDRNEE